MIQVAAECLGIPTTDVYIADTSTNTVPNTSSTAASASSDLNGYAIHNACETLKERLAPYYERLGAKTPLKEIAHAAYFDRVSLSATGFYKTPDIGYVWGENRGMLHYYYTQGVSAAEVEIDTLTGAWTCLQADLKMDVGRSINPAIDYGQIEGAFVQGMGLFTMEESLWHRASGQIATRGPGTYKIPGFRDVPQKMNVSLLKDVEWENLRTVSIVIPLSLFNVQSADFGATDTAQPWCGRTAAVHGERSLLCNSRGIKSGEEAVEEGGR